MSSPSSDRRDSAAPRGPLASSRTIARNTLWNLVGMLLPAIAALAAIPVLVDQLGGVRFGILTLAWGFSVLFALSDLGLGRATTNLLARAWHDTPRHEQAGLVWASLAAHVGLGVLAGGAFAALTPWLIETVLDVPDALQAESRRAFYLLAASIPAVLAGNPLRSVLETTQRFGALNAIRIPMSILNYAGPLLLAPFTPRLEAIVGVIAATRVVGFAAHVAIVRRVVPDILRPVLPAARTIRALARTGGWLGATGLALPAIAILDRVVIGARLTVVDAGHYAAPYEVVTKLWFLSGSLLLVLFPIFSALQDEAGLRRAYWRAVRYLYVPAIAAASVVLALADEAFGLWLGADFGAAAAPVARWLAVGVAISVIGQVPMTLLQCRGRPDVPALVHLAEVPLYGAAAWWAAGTAGITGVAIVWAARAALEAGVLFGAAGALAPAARPGGDARAASMMLAVGAAVLVASAGTAHLPLAAKAGTIAAILILFLGWSWRSLLDRAGLLALLPHREERSSGA